jgi:hypothetical protein
MLKCGVLGTARTFDRIRLREIRTLSMSPFVNTRRNGESWLISDIYLDGAISEVATRRSEFAAILKNEGIGGLIAALNRKADILTATTAKAS